MSEVEILLRRLGATAKYQGFRCLVLAIEIVLEDGNSILMLSKGLYPALAKQFNCTPNAVERNLRTVIEICWNNGDRNLLFQVAGRRLAEKPTCAQFIDMVAAHLRLRRYLSQRAVAEHTYPYDMQEATEEIEA